MQTQFLRENQFPYELPQYEESYSLSDLFKIERYWDLNNCSDSDPKNMGRSSALCLLNISFLAIVLGNKERQKLEKKLYYRIIIEWLPTGFFGHLGLFWGKGRRGWIKDVGNGLEIQGALETLEHCPCCCHRSCIGATECLIHFSFGCRTSL